MSKKNNGKNDVAKEKLNSTAPLESFEEAEFLLSPSPEGVNDSDWIPPVPSVDVAEAEGVCTVQNDDETGRGKIQSPTSADSADGSLIEDDAEELKEELPPPSPEPKPKKNPWSFILFLAVNVIVIGITAAFEFGGDNNADSSSLREIGVSIARYWPFLLCALGCFLGIYLFQAIKISSMLKVTTGQMKMRATFSSVIIGKYYDNITPLAIGGQPFQAYFLAKNGVPAGVATACPIVQLLLGTCGFLTVAATVFIFFGNVVDSTLVRVCAYVGAGLNALTPLAIILFTVMPNMTISVVKFFIKLLHKLRIVKKPDEAVQKSVATVTEYRASLQFMWRSKFVIILGYLLSILEKLSELSITYFVMMACFNGSVNYLETTAITLFIYAATSFIPTPGTAGAAEGTFYIVFGSFWPMFIWRLFSYYSYLFFGFIMIIYNAVKKSKRQKA